MRISPLTVDQVKQLLAETEDLMILDTRRCKQLCRWVSARVHIY